MINPEDLLNSVRQCLAEPTFSIQKNFSIEESKKHYEKWKKQWDNGDYKQNLAAKREEVSFGFGSLSELGLMTTQAHNLYTNLKKEDFNKGVDWYIYGQNIVVMWYRLKTFDEWLHDGLRDALIMASKCPEDGARMILERELGEGHYANSMVHMFAEGKIDKETLKRLGTYEKYIPVEGLDMETAIEKCKELLGEGKEEKEDVTVLTFKI